MKHNATNLTFSDLLSFGKKIIVFLFVLLYTYQISTHPIDNKLQTFIYTLNLCRNLIQLIEPDPNSKKKNKT